MAMQLALIPVSVLMAVVVASGGAQMWMVYPFEVAYGIGGMVNVTAQREMLFSFAGPVNATRVLNTEMAGLASALMLGPLIGGVTIDVFGLGGAFAVPAALVIASAAMFAAATRGRRAVPPAARPVITVPQLAPEAGLIRPNAPAWHLLRRSRPLVVILAVTVVCNLCYFAFMPLVPVVAQRLGAGASLAGVIGAAAGTVQLVTAVILVARPARRPLRAYAGGVVLCLIGLAVLSYAPVVWLALLALAVAGIGQGLFGTTQATLPAGAVPPPDRAAALGLLSTTIGVALPTGMVVLGVTSSLVGAQQAMFVSATVGLVALSALLLGVVPRPGRVRHPVGVGLRRRALGLRGEGDPVAAQPELG